MKLHMIMSVAREKQEGPWPLNLKRKKISQEELKPKLTKFVSYTNGVYKDEDEATLLQEEAEENVGQKKMWKVCY